MAAAQCPGCGQRLNLTNDLRGKKIKCPTCGQALAIPAGPSAARPAPASPATGGMLDLLDDAAWQSAGAAQASNAQLGTRPAASQRKSSGSSTMLLLIGGAGAIVALAGVAAFVAFSLLRREADAEPPANVAAVPPGAEAPSAPAVAEASAPANPAAAPNGPSAPVNAPLAPSSSPAVAAPSLPSTSPEAAANALLHAPPPEFEPTPIEVPPAGALALAGSFMSVGGGNSSKGDTQLWKLDTFEKAGVLLQGRTSFPRQAISHDGKYLVGNVYQSPKPTVSVWSFETGKELRQIELFSSKAPIHALAFAPSGELFASTLGPTGCTARLWNVADGSSVAELIVPRLFDSQSLAFSPDGRRLAFFSSPDILIYDLPERKELTRITLAKSDKGYAHCKGLQFGLDSRELAGVFQQNVETIVYGWLLGDDKPTMEHRFQGDLSLAVKGAQGYKGPALEWLPGGKGYLLFGHELVDRASGRLVWLLPEAPDVFNSLPRPVLASDRLLVAASRGFGKPQPLQVLKLPWPAIDASLKAMAGGNAIVRPGQPISVAVDVGAVRGGTAEQTKAQLIRVLTERLAADGVLVAESQTTVLHVKYEETTGAVLNEVVGSGPLPGQGRVATGRTVQGTRGVCTLKYVGPDGETFWSNVIDLDLKTVMTSQQPSEAAAREGTFRVLTRQLRQQAIPYFVPKDKSLVSLPGVTQASSSKR